MDCPFLGQIQLFPYTFAPQGWLLCDGATYPIMINSALFSLLGSQFGGDGVNTFAVPNLLGAEPTPGMNYYIAFSGLYPSRD